MVRGTRGVRKQLEPYKEFLRGLYEYREVRKTAREIVEIMKHHGIKTSKGALKKLFADWGFKKNIPKADKEILAREKLRNDKRGVESVFFYRNRKISWDKIGGARGVTVDPDSVQVLPYALPEGWRCETSTAGGEIPTLLDEDHPTEHPRTAPPSPPLGQSAPFDLVHIGGALNGPEPAHGSLNLEEFVGVAEGLIPVELPLLGISRHGRASSGIVNQLHDAIKDEDLRGILYFFNVLANIYGSEHQALEARDGTGDRTPLLHAVEIGSRQVAEFLFTLGPRPNTEARTTINGEGPLHMACRLGNEQVARLLLEKGALVDALCYCHRTPLHLAVNGGYASISQHLLDAGAETTVRGSDGRTPADIARENWDSESLQVLGHSEESELYRIVLLFTRESGEFHVENMDFGRGMIGGRGEDG